ncbi:MAG: chromosome segregation protein SMC [Sandaracinaceae bacterium]|nr:MAG: chromosome segregation protein SMC [Sandaracinaceae bacterium]
MKIKKVEVCGFKSFVDRTVVHIDHDVSAIVGPNGCGKSNIVDAIRWAMGEQSARHLRGKAMEDVIFNGSETRGPHSFAEVTLVFDNTAGLGPPEYRDYAEIAVTRRLDRSGHSEYLINKTVVRLKDVTQLFLGTGVGTKAYSIIEQGRIGWIVSAKPTDRRHLIEEAAGITKFKAKKKAAERKMDQTRQNLLRVSDIIGEIEKNLSTLKRQAQKAERYKRYRTEIRDLELLVASHRWMELTVTRRVLENEMDRVDAQVEGSRFALRLREAELGADRLGVQQHEDIVERAQRHAYEQDNSVRVLEGKIEQHLSRLEGLRESERMAERELGALVGQRTSLAAEHEMLAAALVDLEEAEQRESEVLQKENAELDRRRGAAEEASKAVEQARARVAEAQQRIARAEAVLQSYERRQGEGRIRLERMRAEREEHEAKAVELKQEGEALAARLHGLRTGKEQTAERREELQQELDALREQIRVSDQLLETLRGQLAEKRSRLRSLEEIQQRFEGVGKGVRALMREYAPDFQSRADKGVLGLVADRIECPAELTEALAAALGERLQHVVVKDRASAEQALAFLEAGERGRATLVTQNPRRVVRSAAALPDDASVIGWLGDLVGCDAADRPLVRHLLGDVLVVRDAEGARRLHDRGVAAAIVSAGGQVVAMDGSLTGGRGEGVGSHMIAVKREIRELHGVVSELDGRLHTAVAEHGVLRNGIAERRAQLDSARTQAHDAEIAIVKADKDLRRAEESLASANERAERLGREADELHAQLEAASDEERAAKEEIDAARGSEREAHQSLSAGLEIYEGKRAAVDEQSQVVTGVKVRAAEAKQRAESDRGALERLERSIEELSERETRLRGDMESSARQQGETAALAFLAREELNVSIDTAMKAHEHLGEARARYDEAKHELGERESALVEIRRRIEVGAKQLTQLTLQERELAMGLEHLLESIEERHRVDLPKVIGDYHFRELPDAQVKERIGELIRLVERMGEINLTAIEEYDEKSKRYEYLTSQRLDLETALGQLDKAIRQMNRESKRMFRETFDEVNSRFQLVFPKLFGGGKASLKLTDPTDMLETGVEILAQPPGKRLGSIELMSGGEKALTAVSLIFSIFQYKPSPFCLLDEVDAPLDEANIGRFAEAIRSMTKHSQFIVITHSKTTMQMADVLYGVTMETPGISKLVAVEIRGNQAKTVDGGQTVAVA